MGLVGKALIVSLVAFVGVFMVLGFLVFCIWGLKWVGAKED